MKPVDCSLASVATADTTLTSSTPTATPHLSPPSDCLYHRSFFNKRNILVCNNFAEVNDQLFDGPSIHFSNLWNQRFQKFAARLIRFHTGVDFHLKRHIRQQIAMAPATLWIYKPYESHVESCGKYVYYSGVVISSAPVLKCVSMFTGWMQHALLSMRRNCFSSHEACRLWVPSRLWQLPSPWLWASWDAKKNSWTRFPHQSWREGIWSPTWQALDNQHWNFTSKMISRLHTSKGCTSKKVFFTTTPALLCASVRK